MADISPNTKQRFQKLADELHANVEDIEHPPFEIVDNTDDVEPLPADIKKYEPIFITHQNSFKSNRD